MLTMKKELYGFLFLCMHVVVSIVMWFLFLAANRTLAENNNILTWLQSFQVKIEFFLKFLLSLKPLYQIDAYRADYQTRDQEF